MNISDCVFKDEDTKDILNRILELLSVSVLEEDLVSDEKFAGNLDKYSQHETLEY